ncbi:MAG: hypothetical protein ACLUDF_06670 [Butyricicoccus sp.]
MLPSVLGDLPEYFCSCSTTTCWTASRTSAPAVQNAREDACFAEFAHAEEQELVAWLERRAKALGCMIEPEMRRT